MDRLTQFSKRISLKTVFIFSLFLYVVSMAFAWKYIVNSPDVVLSRALENSLQTKSVTKILEQNNAQGMNKQVSTISFAPSFGVQALYTIKQESEEQKVYNETEVLGFRDADYVRYRALESPNIDTNKKAEILNQWARVDGSSDPGQQPSTLNDNLLNLVLFGNVSGKDASKIAGEFKNNGAYTIESYKTKFSRGHHVMELKVNINPKKFVQVLQDNKNALSYIDASSLSVEEATDQAVATTIVVDVLSGQVMQVGIDGSKTEDFTAFGMYRKIDIPANSVPFADFAKKVQSLQKQ